MCCCWYNIGSNALGDYFVHCCVNNYINKLLSMLTNWLNFTICYDDDDDDDEFWFYIFLRAFVETYI